MTMEDCRYLKALFGVEPDVEPHSQKGITYICQLPGVKVRLQTDGTTWQYSVMSTNRVSEAKGFENLPSASRDAWPRVRRQVEQIVQKGDDLLASWPSREEGPPPVDQEEESYGC
jgi:hypothetical protein